MIAVVLLAIPSLAVMVASPLLLVFRGTAVIITVRPAPLPPG